MGNLASQQLNINSDPALVLQQALANREKQYSGISNPQQQLAARLGGLLGGGISNLANDRGFFDVNDPLLNKVTKIQGIYNQVASQIDPASNPEQFYSALQKAYAQDPELGQQALMAAQEAQKAQREGITLESARLDLFTKNPELLDKEIIKAENSGDEEKVAQLAGLQKRVADVRDLERRKAEAQITASDAQAAVAKATSEGKDIVNVPDIVSGKTLPYVRKGDTLVPLKIEGQAAATSGQGQGQGKFNQGRKVGRYVNGKVVYD